MANLPERVLPEHYGSLISLLGSAVVRYRIASADINSISQVRLVTGQRKLLSGLVYIGTKKQFGALSDARVYSGSAIICCGAEQLEGAEADALFNITVIEVTCSVATVFNTLNRILTDSTYVPPMDVRGGLLRTWDHIMNSKLLVHQDIIDALSHSGVEPQAFYRISIVELFGAEKDTEAQKETLIMLRGVLDDLIPQAEVFLYNGGLVIFTFGQSRAMSDDLPLDRLQEALTPFNAYLITGHVSRNYSIMRTLYLICQRSLDIAMNLNSGRSRRTFNVDEYTMYYAIDMCAQRCAQIFGHMDILLLVHPSVVQIRRYDKEHKSDLLDVLANYIRNSGSISKTAEEMYVHRNTINNKLAKIRSLIDMDLDDGRVRQLLLFSCQTLKFYEKILHFEVRPA